MLGAANPLIDVTQIVNNQVNNALIGLGSA